MELIIKKNAEDTALKNAYEIVVTMMHGDADSYTTNEMVFDKEDEELAKFAIATLDEMLTLPWNGARQAYSYMPNFQLWFGDEDLELEDIDDLDLDENFPKERWEYTMHSFQWEWDHRYDENTRCDGYEVFYYDEKGLKHEVEVKK